MSVISAALLLGSVVVLVGGELLALSLWLDFKGRSFTNEPVSKLAARIDELESRLLERAMTRR